ncbi:alpha-hydroxy-acid oxidizing protein [Acidovorax sp. Be4]|uniref:Alpha-hydroxy-acid oxidizing protein n=1 Tax=Acidovorax bellezanensis TaxID=2976702 RepID=A0ABT2PQQ7_9BURK|nr:alpha-hydroxy acid oxidase [Acidovorax sp. Be4]MCT9812799.1 alpha-hydroxy-acid oxidizing protein [Acidovorax sp. Be4]
MTSALPAIQPVSPDIVCLADHERHAAEVLTANAWAYFSGGAADEHSLRANRSAWDHLSLWPRVLRPLAEGHTRIRLLGQDYGHPLLVAPMAYQRLAHADGELASAYAAAALGAGFTLSTQASLPLEVPAQAVLGTAGRGPLWFQLYLQHDRGFTRELVQRVERAGYEALVLTVDAPVSGARDRERRAGFHLPTGISAVNLQGLGAPTAAANHNALCAGVLHHAPSWEDLAWLQAQTRLPVLLKGILHPLDALQAARLQVNGLIVSNHGGRTLDTAPATAIALPRIVQALRAMPGASAELPVIVDGGIRRGTDVLKAMALGASAVMVGRPIVWGLANAGAAGVAHVLRLLRDELEIAMALTGCATLADATPALFTD